MKALRKKHYDEFCRRISFFMSTRITNVHHTLLLLMLYFSTMHTFTLHFTTLPFTFTRINQHFFFFLALPLNYPHVYPCHFTPHIPANIKNNKIKVEEKRSRHATYFFFSTFTFHSLHQLKPKTKPPTLLPFAINNNKGKKILCLKKSMKHQQWREQSVWI